MKANLTKQLRDIEEAITQLDKPKKTYRFHLQYDTRQVESMQERPSIKSKLNHKVDEVECTRKGCLITLQR